MAAEAPVQGEDVSPPVTTRVLVVLELPIDGVEWDRDFTRSWTQRRLTPVSLRGQDDLVFAAPRRRGPQHKLELEPLLWIVQQRTK